MLIAFIIVPLLAGITFCSAFLIAFPNERHAWLCNAGTLLLTLLLLGFGPSMRPLAIGTPMEALGSMLPIVTIALITALWMTGSWSACLLKKRLIQL